MFSFLKHSEKMSYFFTVSRKFTFLKGKPEKKMFCVGGGGGTNLHLHLLTFTFYELMY